MRLLTYFILATLVLNLQLFAKSKNSANMGMDYYIYPNKQTTCKNNFGNGLSFFFEQVGGYDEKAEVEQVSNILNLDLSVFQDVDYDPENKVELEKHWKEIDTFTSIVNTFIAKIKAHPDYYKKVIHNPNKQKQDEEFSRLLYMQDTAKSNQLLEDLKKQPFYYYPPDYEYLSKGRLLKDLHILKETLECYKKNGVTKIRLEYS